MNVELARGPRKRGITRNEFVLCLYEKRSRWQGRFSCDHVMATIAFERQRPMQWRLVKINYQIPLSQTLETYNLLSPPLLCRTPSISNNFWLPESNSIE